MRIGATSIGRKIDVRDLCGKLELRATDEADASLLAVLHNVLIGGGRITVQPSEAARKMCPKFGKRFAYEMPEDK